ncbi:hypothetical protein Ancab_016510, partial [Ancistrocladus abbreviatus]
MAIDPYLCTLWEYDGGSCSFIFHMSLCDFLFELTGMMLDDQRQRKNPECEPVWMWTQRRWR